MKKYVVIMQDKQNHLLTYDLLLAHVEHLIKLYENGKLVLCGPFEDDESALQILLADDPAGARQLVQSDPLVASGYYASFEIKTLIEANPANNWLMDHSQTAGNLGEPPAGQAQPS